MPTPRTCLAGPFAFAVCMQPLLLLMLVLLLSKEPSHTNSALALSTVNVGPVLYKSAVNLAPDDILRRQQQAERSVRLPDQVDIMDKIFMPVAESPVPRPCTAPPDMADLFGAACSSDLPSDFPAGHLLRIGPNVASSDEAFLDGDGMIHCVTLRPGGTCTHSSTYLNTVGRQREAQKGKKYKGTLASAPHGLPLLGALASNFATFQALPCQKDTCNTAVAEMGGRLLALMEQCMPTEFRVNDDGSVTTVEAGLNLDGAIPVNTPITGGGLSAHGRTCPKTGDRVHVSYGSILPPFGRVDIFEKDWKLKRTVGLHDMPSSVMLHDCAITENYAVVLDFPLTLRPTRMLFQDRFPVQYEPSNGARIGLVPRNTDGPTRWFDVKPGVVLHAANAYETGDGKVVVQGQRSEPNVDRSYISDYTAAFMYEWVLDLEDGSVDEQWLNADQLVEFPIVNEKYTGARCDSVYCVGVSAIGGPFKTISNPQEGILIDSIVKMALEDSETATRGDVVGKFVLPSGWHAVSEASVVDGSDGTEYVCMIATRVTYEDARPSRSQLLVLDGSRLGDGPVTAIELPQAVPYGLHSHFQPIGGSGADVVDTAGMPELV